MSSVRIGMGDHISMSISGDTDSLSDETLNQGPLALFLRQQYNIAVARVIVLENVVPPNFICLCVSYYWLHLFHHIKACATLRL